MRIRAIHLRQAGQRGRRWQFSDLLTHGSHRIASPAAPRQPQAMAVIERRPPSEVTQSALHYTVYQRLALVNHPLTGHQSFTVAARSRARCRVTRPVPRSARNFAYDVLLTRVAPGKPTPHQQFESFRCGQLSCTKFKWRQEFIGYRHQVLPGKE